VDERRWIVAASALALDGAAMWRFRPHPATLGRHLAAPAQWLADVGADRAAVQLAGAAVWVVALWLGLALVTMTAAMLPGLAGRWAIECSRRLVPATLHRVLAGALGLGVLVAPVAAGAATTGIAVTSAGRPAAASVNSLPAPVWPTDPTPAQPPAHDQPPTHSAIRPVSSTGSAADRYTVRSGDSLWLIAARRIPHATAAQIASAWPQWYATNRAVIGADPNQLLPGQVLRTPLSTQPTSEAS
jgi:LysM domain